jgi:putative glutamine amidotransferase
MQPALIGITSFKTQNIYGYPMNAVMSAYIQAVARAGGLPLLIPLGLEEAAYQALFARLDGILFTGGGDIQPDLYGGQEHSKVGDVDADRDRVELWLAKQVVEQDKPFLGICRGFQVLNVALGGSLYEDILDQKEGALKHDYYPDLPRNLLAHGVEIAEGSRLANILGLTSTQVNSLHHQGVRQLASRLSATAHAPDGMLEAYELPAHRFGLAVQWHPEWLQEHEPMRKLFSAFVEPRATEFRN